MTLHVWITKSTITDCIAKMNAYLVRTFTASLKNLSLARITIELKKYKLKAVVNWHP